MSANGMKRSLAYILICAALCCACSSGPRIIPRAKMSQIYAEMFLLDARILAQNPNVVRVADTSLVYQSILGRYGYDAEDFNASIQKYLNDPERYSRMLKKSVAIVHAEAKALEKRKEMLESLRNAKVYSKRFAPANIYLMDTLHIDSLWCMDSVYAFDFQKGLDTMYAGPKMIVWADTVGLHKNDSANVAL